MIRSQLGAQRPSVEGDVLQKPKGMTWRDYVIKLLHAAAELEHGLMIQYLYAAYSINTNEPHDDPTLRDKVFKWRNLILTVAREEMGHLLTVQNVVCLLGGPISFGRPDFPWDSPLNPFPFGLRPLSRLSLSCFVEAEMPRDVELEELLRRPGNSDARRFMEKDRPRIRTTIQPLLDEQPHRASVGVIYERIIAILRQPRRIPDSEFHADTYSIQASWDDWGKRYRPAPARPGETTRPKGESKIEVVIRQMASRTQAVEALEEVAGQGEAAHIRSRMEEEQSHFDRLVEVYQDFVDAEDKVRVHAVPTNPNAEGSRLSSPGRITAQSSRTWARLFNVRYRMLLTYLTHTFRLARGEPGSQALRGAVMHKIFGEMYNLKAIAGILVECPLLPDSTDPRRAGAPFEMPYDLTLPLEELDCWRLHRDNVRAAKRLCGLLLGSEKDHLAHAGPGGGAYLRALCALDRETDDWIDHIMTGLGAGGQRA